MKNGSRREFLGVTAAAGAGVIGGMAIPRLLSAQQGEQQDGDPIIKHLIGEMANSYRDAKTNGVRGEHLRQHAMGLRLLAAHLHGRDSEFRNRMNRTIEVRGRQAVLDAKHDHHATERELKRRFNIDVQIRSQPDDQAHERVVDMAANEGLSRILARHAMGMDSLATRLDKSSGRRQIALRQDELAQACSAMKFFLIELEAMAWITCTWYAVLVWEACLIIVISIAAVELVIWSNC